MNWIHIHDGLPESGEEVLVCSKLWGAMPAYTENVSYGICTYCKVGDVLFNEKRHDPIDISDEDFWNSEEFINLLLDEEEVIVEREGFYSCAVDSRSLMVWRWLATCDDVVECGISYWCPLEAPEEP